MAIAYQMRGWDTTALDFVYWTSLGVPDTNPTTTTPPLVGTLTNVCILATDDTAVELPPGGTANQVLAKISGTDYDVHWTDQMGGGGNGSITIATYTMTGITPTVMGSITLSSGIYTAPRAKYGCAHPTFTAYLVLQDALNNQIVTFTAKSGGVTWATAPSGFTLSAETELDALLYTDDTSEIAFIHAFQF